MFLRTQTEGVDESGSRRYPSSHPTAESKASTLEATGLSASKIIFIPSMVTPLSRLTSVHSVKRRVNVEE